MKGIACAKCFTIRSLSGTDLKPVGCECENVWGWWIDGEKGIARFFAVEKDKGFMIGWHNGFLHEAFSAAYVSDEASRKAHEVATQAPGYHFDQSRKACWSVILVPGMSSDAAWATAEEAKAVGLPF